MKLNIKDILKRIRKEKRRDLAQDKLERLSDEALLKRERAKLWNFISNNGQGGFEENRSLNVCIVDRDGKLSYAERVMGSEASAPKNFVNASSGDNPVSHALNEEEGEKPVNNLGIPDQNLFSSFSDAEIYTTGKFRLYLFRDKKIDKFCQENKILNILVMDNLGTPRYLAHIDGYDNSVVTKISVGKPGLILLFHWRGFVTQLNSQTLEFLGQSFTK